MTLESKVLILGAGQIGSRHLQGLANSLNYLRIYVVDTNLGSLQGAQRRWAEVTADGKNSKTVSYHTCLSECPKTLDIVIVATTAYRRVDLLATVKRHALVRYWILEKVLVQSSSDLDRLLELFRHDRYVWVNLPRRVSTWHRSIRDELDHGSPLKLYVSGKAWGLACNAIHFLDLLAWLSGETLTRLSTEGLATCWIEAKRLGNWEVTGRLIGEFSQNSTAVLVVEDGKSTDASYDLDLHDGRFRWHIDEETGIAARSDGLFLSGRLLYQSEVTPILVDQIISTGNCDLPTLGVSAHEHRLYLDAMLAHWRNTVDSSADSVPIT